MIISRISKVLTAGVLSLTLIMTSLTPTSAQAGLNEDEVLGLLTLLLLGGAIHNNRNDRNDRADRPVREPVTDQRRDWRVLPERCIRTFSRQNGGHIRIFVRRCLENAGVRMNRLPQACLVHVRTENGNRRQGYAVRCMRNQGFRTNQH